jgi:hypothetical protein
MITMSRQSNQKLTCDPNSFYVTDIFKRAQWVLKHSLTISKLSRNSVSSSSKAFGGPETKPSY